MINLCNACTIREVCLMHADFIKHSSKVLIELRDCAFRQVKKDGRGASHINEQISLSSKTEIDPFTGKPKVDRDRITELSNKKRMEQEKALKELQKEEQAKPKINMKAKPLKLDYTCPGCGATTFKEDNSKCSCGKDICSCCATTNGDNGELLCPECWQNL